MQNSKLRNVIVPLLVIVSGLAAVARLSDFITDAHPKLPDSYSDSDLGVNGSRLKGFALGMEGLLADWYWLRSLQYIGDKMVSSAGQAVDLDNLAPLNPRLLAPLLQTATNLDPHFIEAYSYGAIVLPAIDKDKAIEFAQKGVANNPNEWKLYQHLGYIFWRLGRYDDAAKAYGDGALIPGSPAFMALMAATMKSEGGSRATARSIFEQMLADSGDEAVRITAERRLKDLDWQDEREAINEALLLFREQNGRCANGFSEISSMLAQSKLPEGRTFRIDRANRLVDPTDVPYLLDRATCSVKLDVENTKLALK